VENPMLDTEVKAIMEKIKHLEEQIAKLEGKQEIN
jgi:polyhydroxyalkanoate synthesis regulator phasin